MNKYKVSFWFGTYNINPFISPSKTVEVESELELTDKEATLEALRIVGAYPKTYSSLVQKI